MERSRAEKQFYALCGEIYDLNAAEELLEWDHETHMPKRGGAGRGALLGTLAGIKHQRLTAPAMREALEACAEVAEPGSVLAAQVRCARRDVEHAVRVPEKLTRALAEVKSSALGAWQEARQAADWAPFAPLFEQTVALRKEEAAALSPDGPAYDALLDVFEPEATEAMLVPLFARLRQALAPLVHAVAERGAAIDPAPVRGEFPADAQEVFGRAVAAAVGFDFTAGTLHPAAHPFCVGINRDDVRLTWRWQEDDFRPALFGILHEVGHGLYEQGLDPEWQRTPMGEATSLGVHESQSRLWENHVGRSRGFWRWALPRLQAQFPGAVSCQVDALWPVLHAVEPSLIRVEADETTYNLHIAVRFELERALFGGDLSVSDLPGAWDDLYEELLGLRPPNVVEGVLQDIHWALGMFGYFPTYTLGTMAAAQLYAAAERELGDLEERFAAGAFDSLLDWLREKIHRQGGRYPGPELIERATGKPLAPDDLLAYLERTMADVYGF